MKACFEMGNDVLASILQFCEGGDLDHFLKLAGPIDEALAAHWTRQIFEYAKDNTLNFPALCCMLVFLPK